MVQSLSVVRLHTDLVSAAKARCQKNVQFDCWAARMLPAMLRPGLCNAAEGAHLLYITCCNQNQCQYLLPLHSVSKARHLHILLMNGGVQGASPVSPDICLHLVAQVWLCHGVS